MELFNYEIFSAMQSLNTLTEMELPVRTSLSLAKLIGKLGESFNVIEKVRVGLINKYGTKNDQNQIAVDQTSENFPKFVEEYNELMNQKTELVFDIVKLPQEINGKPLILKTGVIIPLQKFVEVEAMTVVK